MRKSTLVPSSLFQLLAGLASLLVAGAASALPFVSVDADPDTPGIQSSRTVEAGQNFSIDIVASDITAPSSLSGFEFDLGFDPSVVSALSVSSGDLLNTPIFNIETVVGGMSVEFAEVTLGFNGATGTGTLATIEFLAVDTGSSDLDLMNVILAQPFGIRLNLDGVVDGRINVGTMGEPIPEPEAAGLFAVGLLLAGFALRKKAARTRFA